MAANQHWMTPVSRHAGWVLAATTRWLVIAMVRPYERCESSWLSYVADEADL
jgi:hypothetical protein